jgi:peptidoglycan/xylan/chitin deacetylase (PgdA/CDA1 family)
MDPLAAVLFNKTLVFCSTTLKGLLPLVMFTRLAVFPIIFLFSLSTCKRHSAVGSSAQAASSPNTTAAASRPPSDMSAGSTASPGPNAGGTGSGTTTQKIGGKAVVDQTAQVIVFGWHRFVDKVRRPDTEITPQDFEKQMQELKDHGISVIGMQDFLAWKRSEKSIPPRSAVLTFDDGWKSQYEVGWPILKKFGYPVTLFIYTEGVRGGHFGGGEAMTWEMLAEMRDAGADIQAHSATHQDLRKPYDKVAKKKLSPPEYDQWLQNEIVGSKQLLEQRLGIKVNCFAVPYGFYNEKIKETCKAAGYDAVFTVYGQPITFNSPLDNLGRYLIEANKPKVFVDAIKTIGTSSGGAAAVAEVGATSLASQPADGETIRTALPLIKANLSSLGPIEPNSVQMRVSGLGQVPASFDPKTGIISYQVTQKLRDKTCTVIVSAKSEGKKVEAHWTFGVEEGGAAAAPSQTPKK